MVQLLVHGSTALHMDGGSGSCTDVTVDGLQMQGYDESMRNATSGIRAERLAPCDIIDAVRMNG
eukprot:COSAG03_NODE_5403_length_1258_cov_1.425367_2_plen_63_part_01